MTAALPCDLAQLATPSLLLDQAKLDANCARLDGQLARLAPAIMPRVHLKTAKSVDVASHVLGGTNAAITVSTLREAEFFAAAGYSDILYAVGMVPAKLDRVIAMRRAGAALKIITDNLSVARAVAEYSREHDIIMPTLIEIDCDGQRAGVVPDNSEKLLAIAEALGTADALAGVMTHAGGSYAMTDRASMQAMAAQEVAAVNQAAALLREAGYQVPIVSIGSTPTALQDVDRQGVTEIRAGVYMFFDLVMAGLGMCEIEDIALSVLTSVIGHQPDKGWILVDAGWMAMSRDRGTAGQAIDQGYGLVCDVAGQPLEDLTILDVNQEHGIIALRKGSKAKLPDLPVGSLLRILPNHACATAAQHDQYQVIGPDGRVTAQWPRFDGW